MAETVHTRDYFDPLSTELCWIDTVNHHPEKALAIRSQAYARSADIEGKWAAIKGHMACQLMGVSLN